jgi:hypothetical protein
MRNVVNFPLIELEATREVSARKVLGGCSKIFSVDITPTGENMNTANGLSLHQDGEIRKIICGLASLFFSCPVFSTSTASVQENVAQALQPVCAISGIDINNNILKISSAPRPVESVIRRIAAIAGIAPNFEAVHTKSLNGSLALAAIRNGKRYVVYDSSVYKPTDVQITWQHVGVLAHEVGHHIASHTAIQSSDPHAQELEADAFSGYAVSLLGGYLGQALAFTDILSERDSATHPGRDRRKVAVTAGWEQAETLKRLGGLSCTPSWMSPELWLSGGECRLARRCEGNSARVLLACRKNGNWEGRSWRDVSVNAGVAK